MKTVSSRHIISMLAIVFMSLPMTAKKSGPVVVQSKENHECCNRVQYTPIQHAPGAGVTECHNYNDKSKNVKADCPCWGQYAPDYEKCKPPSEEDKKCRNYCKSSFCKCKIKCQS